MLQHFSSCNNISLIFRSFVILGQIYTNIKDTHITYIWKLLKIEDTEKGQSAFYRVTRCVSNKLALWWCSVLCPTLWDPMDYSLPGSYVHGIFQARILEGVPFPTLGDLLTQAAHPHFLSLLHWQADSLQLSYMGSPLLVIS